jgi:hypothetical protein
MIGPVWLQSRVVHAVLMAWRYRRLMREARANHTWDRLQMRAEIDRLSAQQTRLAIRLAQEGMDRERAEEECRALDETVRDLRRALQGERKRAGNAAREHADRVQCHDCGRMVPRVEAAEQTTFEGTHTRCEACLDAAYRRAVETGR